MNSRSMLLTIIIPVFNEQDYIANVIESVRAVDLLKEIIVVDDGSTDATPQLLRAFADEGIINLVALPKNQGKGAAIRHGIEAARGDIIVIQDADLEYDPAQLPELVRPIISGEADVVYGSRFLGTISGMRWTNRWANRLLTFMTNVLYGASITDEETCYKTFRAPVLKALRLRSRRFGFEPEVTARVCRSGIRIHEVPIAYVGRSHAEGKKIGWMDGLEAIWTLIRCRFF